MNAIAQTFQRAGAAYNSGNWAHAEELCRSILRAQPDHFDSLNLLGVIAAQTGRLDEAADLFGRAAAANPANADAHCNCGNVHASLGRHSDALVSYERALKLDPRHADVHFNRGNVLLELRRFGEALLSYESALTLKPDHAEAHLNRGNLLHRLGRFGEALGSYERALMIRPGYAEVHFARGNSLRQLGRFDDALGSYDAALTIRPDYAEAHNSRGNALKELQRPEDALESYRRALEINPGNAEACNNLGNLYRELNRLDAALNSYNRAISINPNFAVAHLNRSVAQLTAGDYENGWLGNEWRWKLDGATSIFERRGFLQPLWLGGESLEDKTILLHSEQGLGDTIQFCRYATLAARLGASVILEVEKPLVSLLSSLNGVTQIVGKGDALPAFDYHCPLMSLPLAFKTTLSTVPASVPYLRASVEKKDFWQRMLGGKLKPRVGLVWSGGFRPNAPEVWTVNRRRNIPLAKLAALKRPDVEFYSLQIGEPAESELAQLVAAKWDGPEIIDHTKLLRDFSDTAALVEQMDLVISVDTSTAHLAGALGMPVWMLNRFDTCWRWLLNRRDSPWYPTLTLYRQEALGDWNSVVERVSEDLPAFLDGRYSSICKS
jgi:tetratricopeptide (TPR) repeat protein